MLKLKGLLGWSISLIAALCWAPPASLAATPFDARAATRAKLDRLLLCQQAEKEAAVDERRTIQGKISDIESFISSLDKSKNTAAHAKAGRALAVSRAALMKSEERVQLADRLLGLTLRAIAYLPLEATRLEQEDEKSRRDHDFQPSAEDSARSDDALLEAQFGFVLDPKEIQRLEALVHRVQALSSRPDVPVTVRVLGKGFEYASATATTIYFAKDYLDQNPSESELLFVVGHELAHVQLGHHAKTITGRERDEKSIQHEFGQEGYRALGERTKEALMQKRAAPWGRKMEVEADILGAQQALEAGALPTGIFELFRRLDKEESLEASSPRPDIQQFRESLLDHPKSMDRLKKLEEVLGEKFWEEKSLSFSSPCHRR